MQYTVWNRGSLVGRTDLAFRRCMSGIRCGWFQPAPGSDRVMRVVSAVSPALRAVVHREVEGGGDAAADASGGCGTTELADLAEAFQHLDGLELELRRDDGSVVPVVDIGIQDMAQLVELAQLDDRIYEMTELDGPEWDADDGLFSTAEFADGIEPLLDDDDDTFGAAGDDSTIRSFSEPSWPASGTDGERSDPGERYQILVTLVDDDAIP